MVIHQSLLLFLLVLISWATTTRSTSYLLSCGSNSTVETLGSRDFISDSSSEVQFSPKSIPLSSLSSSLPPLYSSARVFKETSSYEFTIPSPSPYFLRLHFYPFPSPSFNLSISCFSISASGLTLLANFTPASRDPNNLLVLKEFFLNISLSTFTLSFTPQDHSFAFVNAIELSSTSPKVFPGYSPVTPVGTAGEYNTQVLETLYRINIGGNKVSSTDDHLNRSWEADGTYLLNDSLGRNINTSIHINYESSGTSTWEVAPEIVYQSARVMYNSTVPTSSPENLFNLTWALPVHSGGKCLVRMHFCDLVSQSDSDQFYFDVYLDDQIANQMIDLRESSNRITTAYYYDFLVDNSTSLLVSVGPNKNGSNIVNAILNGLEVMELINGVLVPETNGKSRTKLIVGKAIAGCSVIVVLAIIVFVMLRCKKNKEKLESETKPLTAQTHLRSCCSSPPTVHFNLGLKIPLIDIQAATDDFSEDRQIGSGGFGKVYKAHLPDGMLVAVKRATPGSKQGLHEFQTEISMLSKIRHRHLVSLIGYCDEQGEMILVYEFMEKGTLKNHLYNTSNPSLSWKQRLEICVGSARGLHYLHNAHSQAIIHRDVKSANILLDENYSAKVADFGLSKLGPPVDQTYVSTAVKGSFGYLDPEYFKMQQLTEKSDVYSFGVVLLEVICARPVIDHSLPYEQINLADWAMVWLKKGKLEQIVDPGIRDQINPTSLRKFGETVQKCLAPYGVQRPPMADVLWSLEYTLQLQENREPSEYSANSLSMVPVVNVRRIPSTNTNGFQDTSVADSDLEGGTSLVFSQLRAKDGR